MLSLFIVPCLGLLCLAGLPDSVANRYSRRLGHVTVWLAGGQLVAAIAGAGWLVYGALRSGGVLGLSGGSAGDGTSVVLWPVPPLIQDLMIDLQPITIVMLSLVSFISWVIAIFSQRYLDGDPNQGRYFKWLAVTVAAVCLTAVAGSLLLFGFAWALSSLGIHQLLMHFPNRVGARQAAWTKFTVSRCGDVAILIAVALLLYSFGTTRFGALSEQLATRPIGGGFDAGAAVAWLLCLAACFKSAQFPFHTWLPQTVETPTPVSALMHAGVVNAGGYLLIRVNPLLAQHAQPLQMLAIIGAATVLIGGVVMMTQSSIKRSLAYSTVAQMGFMILQCGLGAFGAAFLHIIAHSLYKANAFLSSGSVVPKSKGPSLVADWESSGKLTPDWPVFAFSAVVTVSLFALALGLFGVDPSVKPGGWILSCVICLAFVSGVWRAVRTQSYQAIALALCSALGLSLIYVACYLGAERLVGPVASVATPMYITVLCISVFGLLFGLQLFTERSSAPRAVYNWFARLYVHASNGFYLESVWKRLLGLTAAP